MLERFDITYGKQTTLPKIDRGISRGFEDISHSVAHRAFRIKYLQSAARVFFLTRLKFPGNCCSNAGTFKIFQSRVTIIVI